MGKIYNIGDLHLSCMNEWNSIVDEKFLNWFTTYFKNKNDDSIIFLGDVTDKDTNPGDVIDEVFRLFDFCSKNFKSTFVTMGNHDKKLFKFTEQHSLKFINNFPNVQVVETMITFHDIQGHSVRFMPFQRLPQGKTINSYYNSIEWEKLPQVDLTVGHWNAADPSNFLLKDGVDISKIPTKNIVLGHIHTRLHSYYTGSVFPVKVNEQDSPQPRCIKVLNEDNYMSEVILPHFLDYETINVDTDPKNLIVDDAVKVYTVTNCSSVQKAEQLFPNKFIRAVIPTVTEEKDSVDKSSTFLFKNNADAFDKMIKEQKIPISRSTYSLIKSLI